MRNPNSFDELVHLVREVVDNAAADALREVVQHPEACSVTEAMSWNQTPQGGPYWSDVAGRLGQHLASDQVTIARTMTAVNDLVGAAVTMRNGRHSTIVEVDPSNELDLDDHESVSVLLANGETAFVCFQPTNLSPGDVVQLSAATSQPQATPQPPSPTALTMMMFSSQASQELGHKAVQLMNGAYVQLGRLRTSGNNWATYYIANSNDIAVAVHGRPPINSADNAMCIAEVTAAPVIVVSDDDRLILITANALGEPIECRRNGSAWGPAAHLAVVDFDWDLFEYRMDESRSREWWRIANEMGMTKRNGKISLTLDPVAARTLYAALVAVTNAVPSGVDANKSPLVIMARLKRMLAGQTVCGTTVLTDGVITERDIPEVTLPTRIGHGAKHYASPTSNAWTSLKPN